MFLYGREHKLCSSLLLYSINENLVTWSPDTRKTGKYKFYFGGERKRAIYFTLLKLKAGSISRNKEKFLSYREN